MDARMNAPADAADEERFPTLTEAGRAMLHFLREHPRAPIFRNRSGNRLLAAEVEQVCAWERAQRVARVGWQPGELPEWVRPFAERCIAEVPFFRRYGALLARWEEVPTTSRADLSRDVAQFVSDSIPTERLLRFSTSGTTGHPLWIPSLPLVAARGNRSSARARAGRRSAARLAAEVFHLRLRHARSRRVRLGEAEPSPR